MSQDNPTLFHYRAMICLLVVPLPGCTVQSLPPRTVPNPQVRVTGPETWHLESGDVQVLETALIRFKDGTAMLVAKVSHETKPGPEDKAHARAVARYLSDNGYLAKAEGKKTLLKVRSVSEQLGVALVEPSGKSGYRFNFSLDDLDEY